MTKKLLDCALIGVCAVIRSNTVLSYLVLWLWENQDYPVSNDDDVLHLFQQYLSLVFLC